MSATENTVYYAKAIAFMTTCNNILKEVCGSIYARWMRTKAETHL